MSTDELKIALIGTYPNRECGIATFSKNLFHAISSQSKHQDNVVIALNDTGKSYLYPEEVKLTIDQNDHASYLKAAEYINSSDIDLCFIQHEFGIFGGQNGVFALSLMHHINIPIIVTLHTVLKKPNYNELYILKEICRIADKVIVMNQTAVDLLLTIYEAKEEKIEIIPHGVPDIKFDREEVRKELGIANKKVLLTFGFIGRNKGIETVIKALPEVVKINNDVLYIVLGKTHPNVIKSSGEEYREFLNELVLELGLEGHVIFLNQYASQQDLFKYLHALDIYITPYPNEIQISSGTLSYAIGCGAAVVSTPYWHAAELLAGGRGILFDFNNYQQLTQVLIDLLNNPGKIEKLRSKALEFGNQITWPKTGTYYYQEAVNVVNNQERIFNNVYKKTEFFDVNLLPPLRMDHVLRMTDSTGIFQHGMFGIPNYHEGYCLDDNARALLMALMAYRETQSETALKLIPIYLGYIHYAQNEDGTIRNFMSYDRNFLDDVGSEDAFGRAIWAIGYAMAHAPFDAYSKVAAKIFYAALPQFEKTKSIRSIANIMLGLYHYLKANPYDEAQLNLMSRLALKLKDEYILNSSENWQWYESILAYDNALLPLAMLYAAELLNDEEIKKVALDTVAFLEHHTMNKGHLSLVGNQSWFRKDKVFSQFAQQPVDAMATVLMFIQAYQITEDEHYLNASYLSFMWFFGENDLHVCLYDFETHGCCDGLQSDGLNRNQGAESILAYVISYLALFPVFITPNKRMNQQEKYNQYQNSKTASV